MTANKTIAYFISPHGFGHASRAAAVMEAMHDLDPSLKFEIFTKVPRWFFDQSLTGAFEYHSYLSLTCWTPAFRDMASQPKVDIREKWRSLFFGSKSAKGG